MICFRWLLPSRYVFVLEGYTPLEARLAKFADRQLALSDALANLCYEKHGYRPRVIPVGIDRNLFRPEGTKLLPRAPGEKIVLTVSRLVWHKNVDVFLEAARLLCREKKGITFYIIGDGPERSELERTVDQTGLQGRIRFLGQVPKEDLPGYYRSADVFVSCEAAVDEYWITCQESISCGIPVVWTCHRQTQDEPSTQGWGFSVPPKKPQALAHAIAQVVENEQNSRNLVQRGLKIAAQQDMVNVIKQYENEYLGFHETNKRIAPIS
jgi:glycosyltransferase involved in cell wall biosynthesis